MRWALAGIGLWSLCLAGQGGNSCKGPPDLESALRAEPTAEVHSALGYWFVERQNLTCAIEAFRAAVRLDGNSFEAPWARLRLFVA